MYAYKTDFSIAQTTHHSRTCFYTVTKTGKCHTNKKKQYPGFKPRVPRSEGQQRTCSSNQVLTWQFIRSIFYNWGTCWRVNHSQVSCGMTCSSARNVMRCNAYRTPLVQPLFAWNLKWQPFGVLSMSEHGLPPVCMQHTTYTWYKRSYKLNTWTQILTTWYFEVCCTK